MRFLIANPATQHWTQLPAQDWLTPAWKANRRGFYMVTNDQDQHPWLLEDVGLRAIAASKRFAEAVRILEKAKNSSRLIEDVEHQLVSLRQITDASRTFGTSLLTNRHT